MVAALVVDTSLNSTHPVLQVGTTPTLYYGPPAMSTSVSVRLPDPLVAQLVEVASATERSKSFVIQKALEAYLADQADFQIALDRLNDPTDTVVSLDDMRSELGL